MTLHEFYRRYAKLKPDGRNTILREVRHDPLTPFIIYKQLENVRAELRYYKAKEEELLRIAEETFNQVENRG